MCISAIFHAVTCLYKSRPANLIFSLGIFKLDQAHAYQGYKAPLMNTFSDLHSKHCCGYNVASTYPIQRRIGKLFITPPELHSVGWVLPSLLCARTCATNAHTVDNLLPNPSFMELLKSHSSRDCCLSSLEFVIAPKKIPYKEENRVCVRSITWTCRTPSNSHTDQLSAIRASSVQIHHCGFTPAHHYSCSFTLSGAESPQIPRFTYSSTHIVKTRGLEGSDRLGH